MNTSTATSPRTNFSYACFRYFYCLEAVKNEIASCLKEIQTWNDRSNYLPSRPFQRKRKASKTGTAKVTRSWSLARSYRELYSAKVESTVLIARSVDAITDLRRLDDAYSDDLVRGKLSYDEDFDLLIKQTYGDWLNLAKKLRELVVRRGLWVEAVTIFQELSKIFIEIQNHQASGFDFHANKLPPLNLDLLEKQRTPIESWKD
jgi:hypothetical protein